jgi:hypothetical protein
MRFTELVSRPAVVRNATAINILTWLGQAAIAFVHDPSGNHSVEGFAEHLQLALITLSALSLIPIVLRLGAAAGAGRAAAISVAGANGVGALCIISNINSGDPAFFTVVAVPSMLSWFAGFIVVAVAAWRSGALPKAYALALPLTWILGTVGAQAGLGVATAAFWFLVARRLDVFATSGTAEPEPVPA